jgi:hypothetical protein
VIAFDQLHTARLGARDDAAVRCGGSENCCRDQLAYIDTLPNGVRWLFFDPGWHVDYSDDALLFDWLRGADPVFAHLQGSVAVWKRTRHARGQHTRPGVVALPNGAQAGGLRRARLPALAICWDGHVNVLDAARLQVK